MVCLCAAQDVLTHYLQQTTGEHTDNQGKESVP